MRSILALSIVAACLSTGLAAGCSSSTTGAGTTGSGGATSTSTGTGGSTTGTGTGGAGDPGVLVGSFVVRATPPMPATGGAPETPGSTAVLGEVNDGPSPSALIWVPGTKDGDCQILTPKVPFCATPCGGSAVCVADDTCQPYPTAHSVGTVTLSGLLSEAGAVDIEMKPIANNYQPPAAVKLVYPAFVEGVTIRFVASGDFFQAFTVESTGVAPLDLLGGKPELAADQPLSLAWTPPGKAGISTVHVKLDISHHGGPKGMISCDTADTGSLTITAPLITELLGLGVAGYPSIIVTRKATGSTTIAPGRVDAVVLSEVEREIGVPGLVSCTPDPDCPPDQTCPDDECPPNQTCHGDLTCQ